MPWSIPDKGEAADVQSILFQEYLDAVIAGINGLDHVIAGCAVTAQGAPNMTVAVAAGTVCSNLKWFAVTAGNGTITTAHATLPRIDLVVATSAGAVAVRAGTANANPKPPARSANDVILAAVLVLAADTTIEADKITDLRVVRDPDRAFIRADATRTFVSNTNSQAIFTSPANGRITLPPGLYRVEGVLIFTAMSATSGNLLLNLLGAGTATVGAWAWTATGTDAAAATVGAISGAYVVTSSTAAAAVTAGTGVTLFLNVQGTFEVTAGGTMIPSVSQLTAAAAVLSIGSYLAFDRLGETTDVSIGPFD
jgi:hypothetical protein